MSNRARAKCPKCGYKRMAPNSPFGLCWGCVGEMVQADLRAGLAADEGKPLCEIARPPVYTGGDPHYH